MTKIATDFAILSDVVKYEDDQDKMWGRNRSNVTFTAASAGVVPVGTVLGKVTASGKYKVVDPDASTGEQVASAIVAATFTAASGDNTNVLVLGAVPYQVHVGVLKTGLVYGAGVDAGEQTAAEAQLSAVGFQIIREIV